MSRGRAVKLKVSVPGDAAAFLTDLAAVSHADLGQLVGMALGLGVKKMQADITEWGLPQPSELRG